MDSAAILEQIVVIVSEQSGLPVTAATPLDMLGLDSLDYVSIAQTLETLFGIGPIPDSDLFKLVTVRQVAIYVESWLAKKSAVEAAADAQ